MGLFFKLVGVAVIRFSAWLSVQLGHGRDEKKRWVLSRASAVVAGSELCFCFLTRQEVGCVADPCAQIECEVSQQFVTHGRLSSWLRDRACRVGEHCCGSRAVLDREDD